MKKNDNYKFYSIDEFCTMVGISRYTFLKWRSEGIAPKIIEMRRRIFISPEALETWRKKYEK